MVPSYLDGNADIGIEDIDKINTALFNLEEAISTYKPKETKQDYGIVSLHGYLSPGSVFKFDPPVYETPIVAVLRGKPAYIGTLDRNGLLTVEEFSSTRSSSSVSELTSETVTEYETLDKDVYEKALNQYVEEILESVASVSLQVSKSAYQAFGKYSCPGIKLKYGNIVTFISGFYKNCKNPDGDACDIEIKIDTVQKAWVTDRAGPRGVSYFFTSTNYVPGMNYYQISRTGAVIQTLGVPASKQEWDNWKTAYGSYLCRRGVREWLDQEERYRTYYGNTYNAKTTDITITQIFDNKERGQLYIDADVPYRRA